MVKKEKKHSISNNININIKNNSGVKKRKKTKIKKIKTMVKVKKHFQAIQSQQLIIHYLFITNRNLIR